MNLGDENFPNVVLFCGGSGRVFNINGEYSVYSCLQAKKFFVRKCFTVLKGKFLAKFTLLHIGTETDTEVVTVMENVLETYCCAEVITVKIHCYRNLLPIFMSVLVYMCKYCQRVTYKILSTSSKFWDLFGCVGGSPYQWWIHDSSEEEGTNSQEGAPTYKLANFFAENCMKMKEFGPGWARVPGAPL